MSTLKKFLIVDLVLAIAVVGLWFMPKILGVDGEVYNEPEVEEEVVEETTAPEALEEIAEEAPEMPEPIDTSEWNLLLVNPWNAIPEGYSVDTAWVNDGYEVDSRVADSLEEMMADCRAAGHSPVIISAFRTHETQQYLYDTTDNKNDTAYPGTSEHECGLAVDILETGYGNDWDNAEKTAETETQKWLTENCHNYGFILRYPSGKEDVTGIVYESWHYRYVGKEHAAKIMESGQCLEEYLGRIDNDKEKIGS